MGFLEHLKPFVTKVAALALDNKLQLISFVIEAAQHVKADEVDRKAFIYNSLKPVAEEASGKVREALTEFFNGYDFPVLEGDAEAQVEAEIIRVVSQSVQDVLVNKVLAQFSPAS